VNRSVRRDVRMPGLSEVVRTAREHPVRLAVLGAYKAGVHRHLLRVTSAHSRVLPTYWSMTNNFGDRMSGHVVRSTIDRWPIWAPPEFGPKLVGQGSVIGRSQHGDVVWGSGYHAGPIPSGLDHVLALRGPLTHEKIGLSGAPVYGDPGLLAPQAYGVVADPEPRYRLGIVRHLVDSTDVSRLAADASVLTIEPDWHPRRVIQAIASVEMVASSSLHGLVIADALDIPSVWISPVSDIEGGEFKYRDYYLGSDREPSEPVSWDQVHRAEHQDLPRNLGAVQERLRVSLRDWARTTDL
jgi:pyruvyltransferase